MCFIFFCFNKSNIDVTEKYKYFLSNAPLVTRMKKGLIVLGLMAVMVLSAFAGGDGAPMHNSRIYL